MHRSRRRRARVLLLAVGGGLTLLVLLGYATDALRRLELSSVDARFAIRGAQRPPSDVVLVEIDDVTFNDLHSHQFPFPRRLHARVIDRIAADGPRAIAYDVQFTELSPNPRDDVALAQSIAGANHKIVLATTETNSKGQSAILGGERVLRAIGARDANALLPADPGGVDRRVSFAVDKLKSLAVVTAEVVDRHPVNPSLFDGRAAWIDYYGPSGAIPAVSFSRVLKLAVPRGFFRNKVVVVGPSAPSLQDIHATPTSAVMPGVEIQANAIQSVRRNLPLKGSPGWLDVALILLLGLAAPLASLALTPLRAISVALVLGGAFTLATQLAFDSGRILVFVYPIAALALSSSGSLGVQYATAAVERERVRDLFSRFVPENVVSEVLARAEDGLRLGGVECVCTVMFTDLRGFTSFAESLTPDRVIQVLNEYLGAMSDAILDHGGTLVSYMGDGIMAIFGAPIPRDNHADDALATAREMLEERLPRFNAWLRSEGLGDGFRMGIGLNSGPVMSGNVGSERRLEYTAIGDTTNTASRLEGMTKGTPHQLLLADSTRALLGAQPSDLIFVDELAVRGRQSQVKLFSLAERAAAELPGATSNQPEIR